MKRRIEVPHLQIQRRVVFETSPWVNAIGYFHEALPLCSESNLLLISPRDPKHKKLMKGHWFKAKRYEVKEKASKDFVVEQGKKKRQKVHRMVALDPGVATFQTSYGSDGVMSMWGRQNNLNRINEQDIEEMHSKLIKWLCTTYDLIIMPHFGLRTRWKHTKFLKQLISTAPRYNTEIHLIEEFCTTQTCSACGIRTKMRKNCKTFACPGCNFRGQRDINAARNILLKYLEEEHS